MALEPSDGGSVSTTDYQLVGAVSTFRNGPNNTLVPVEEITARSTLYDVTFTFDVSQSALLGESAAMLASDKTGQVNAIGAYDHVIGLRSEQDTGNDGNVYNYLVITVGTADGLISTDVRVRMDSIGAQSAYAAIDNAWKALAALGAQ